MSGARIVWPARPSRPLPAVLPRWMPNCPVVVGRAARSLKFWSIMWAWASVRWSCRRLAKCVKKGAGCCWCRPHTSCTARPGRLGALIWRGWPWCRRHGHATPCGRPSKPCRAARWVWCCAGRRRSMPSRRGVCRWPSPAATVWLFCFGRCKPRPSLRRLPCVWCLPPVRVASWRLICLSGAARRVPKLFISMCRDR